MIMALKCFNPVAERLKVFGNDLARKAIPIIAFHGV